MSVLTLDQAKAQLNITSSSTELDTELGAYVASVDTAIERQTRTVVDARDIVERHTVRRQGTLVLRKRPVTEIMAITQLDGTKTWDPANLDLDPAGILRVLSGPAFDGLVKVEYTAGYTTATMPENYGIAARIILQHLWETQRGRFGSPRPGGLDTPVAGRGYALPKAALELLGAPGPAFA